MCENNGDGNARERDGALARLSSTKHVLIESFYAAAKKETVIFFLELVYICFLARHC